MAQLKAYFLKTIDWMTLIILFPLMVASLFFSRSVNFNTFKEVTLEAGKSPFMTVYFSLVLVFVFYYIVSFLSSNNETINRIFSYGLICVMCVCLLIEGILWIKYNPFQPVADQEKVWTAATYLATGQPLDTERLLYFDTYPSQKSMSILMSFVAGVWGSDVNSFRYFNLFMILITSISIILCVKVFVYRTEIINVLSTILIIFFPWILYCGFVYGQITAMAFSVVSLLGVFMYYRTDKKRWLIIPTFFMPLAILAYHAMMIFYFALAVVLICTNLFSTSNRNKWIICIAVILSIYVLEFAGAFLSETYFDRRLGRINDGGDGVPAVAYLVSGIEQEQSEDFPGGESSEKEIYEECGRDSSMTANIAIETIKRDLEQYLKGERNIGFFAKKTEFQWLDPWFGGLTMTVYSPESGISEWDGFVNSDILKVLEKLIYVLMVFVYIGAVLCQVDRIRNGSTSVLTHFPNIYFIGGFVFQMFWEQKSRYCLPYYMALFPLAAIGIVKAVGWTERRGGHYDLEKKPVTNKRVYIFVALALSLIVMGQYIRDKESVFIPTIDYSDSQDMYYTDDLALAAGDYGITMEYTAKQDTEVSMCLGDPDTLYPAILDKNENSFYYEMHIDEYNDRIHYVYSVNQPDDFRLNRIKIESGKALYTDHIFDAFLFLIATFLIYSLFTSDRYVKETRQGKLLIIGIVVSIVFVSLPLFSQTLFWGADDPAHVMRLEGIKDALINRQFPVFVFPKNDQGYGLLGYMYPSLFIYVPAIVRILRVSIPTVMNCLFFGINLVTAIVAYCSAREIYDKKEAAYLYTILYLLLPYRLVNIYNRADVGESLGMCFLPLIIAGMYMCLDERKRKDRIKVICYITLGMTCIINSHVLSSVLIMVLIILYVIVFIRRLLNKDAATIIVGSVMLTGLLNIGYIIPFIKMYRFGLNISYMTGKVFSGYFSLINLLGIYDFSSGAAWGGISIIGLLGIVIFVIGIVAERKEKSLKNSFMLFSGALAVLLFVMVPSEFPWDMVLSIRTIRNITDILQFSFRIVMISAPLLTMAAVYYLYNIRTEYKIRYTAIAALLIAAVLSVTPGILGEMRAEPYMQKLSGGASDIVLREYWPAGVTDGVFNDDRLYWSSEDLTFEGYEKNGLRVGFRYSTQPGKDEWIEPPILYYPGYKAVATDAEGNKYNLGVTQGNYYRVRVDLPSGISGSSVKLYYGGLWYFYIAYVISIVSAIVFTLVIIRRLVLRRKEAS